MSIERIHPSDPLSQSKDLVKDSIEKLKALFPQIVTEDKIDFNVLKEILGEEVEHGEEYYRFTWAGKTQARREAHKPSTGTLIPVKEESLDWETPPNLYIEGDNLEVLKLLQKSYAEKVKMIYIDPPYNTGSDFVYKDDYGDNLRNYQEFTGQLDSEGNRLSTNSDSDGRYHSNWLNMMYPRLILAKNLLRDDGVIFISIDEHEVHNIRLLMENLFGRENLFAEMVVVRAEGGGLAKKVIKGHDYLLVFVKSQSKFKGIYRPKDIRGQVVEIDRRKFWIEEDWLREEFGKYGTLHYEDIEEVKGIDKKNEIDTAIEEGLYVLLKKGKKHIVGRYRALKDKMRWHIIPGIKYQRIGDSQFFNQELFEKEELFRYTDDSSVRSTKSPYEFVVCDSKVESKLTKQFEQSPNVTFYSKLPSWFKIDTPLGTYNPDWVLSWKDRDQEKLFFFVAESKGSIRKSDLRDNEKSKFECGEKHFKALNSDSELILINEIKNIEDQF